MLWIVIIFLHMPPTTHVAKPVQPSAAKGKGTKILVNDTKYLLGTFGAVEAR
jgi:hypothetical protein